MAKIDDSTYPRIIQTLLYKKNNLTTLFEDNDACIVQIKRGYIKRDRIKHIFSKFFYTHELQKSAEIDIHQICSSDNLADLFVKSLLTSTFKKLIYKIEMCQLKDIYWHEGEHAYDMTLVYCTLFLFF